MGSKDILEKHLESYNDVFADMINVFIFDGKSVIAENELEDIDPNSFYVEDNQVRNQERDISKKWIKKDIILSFLGIENQTTIDSNMPFRVIGYEGVSYKYMLANNIKPCPVVTLVLNFSMTRWTKHKTLLEELTVDKELKPFVNDYKVNVIDVAYLSRETINKFKSDFKIIADYFVQMRETGEYIPMTDEVKHIWELLNLMSVLTDDDRFKVDYYNKHRRERTNMCEVLDRIIEQGRTEGLTQGIAQGRTEGIAQGRTEGIAQGRTEGITQGKIMMIKKMIGKYSNEEIADISELSVSEVEKIAKSIITLG